MTDSTFSTRRLQQERDVALVATSAGQCQLSTQLDTPSSASTAIATGTMFSVTAKQAVEIMSFEFGHFTFDGDLQVQIYTLEGKDYLSNRSQPQQWTLVSETTGVESPDEEDENIMISPRADMAEPLLLSAGESRSFYFTLKSQHLQLDQSSSLTTGQEYFSDSILQTDVGIGIRLSDFPTSDDDANRAFQGRIHYRSIENCADLLAETEAVVRVAVNPTTVPQSPNEVFRSAFAELLDGQVDWARWTESQGLQLINVQASTVETKGKACV
jgi:hypothetical protein